MNSERYFRMQSAFADHGFRLYRGLWESTVEIRHRPGFLILDSTYFPGYSESEMRGKGDAG